MPYESTASLPKAVKSVLPKKAQEVFLAAFNSAFEKHGSDERAAQIAWGAVKNAGYKKSGGRWIKANERHKYYTFSYIDEPQEGTAEIQIAKLGEWKHDKYGVVRIEDDDLADAVTEFQSGERREIQMNYDHRHGKASGWIKKLIHRVGDGLYAMVKFTDRAREAIRAGEYKYISPELNRNWIDKRGEKTWRLRIAGAALTNRPYFEGMRPVAASEDGRTLTLYMAEDVDDGESGARADSDDYINTTSNGKDLNMSTESKKVELDAEKLKEKLGIKGEFSEDRLIEKFSEVSRELAHLRNEKEQTSNRADGLEEMVEELKGTVKEMEEKRFAEKTDALLNKAMSENRIDKARADKFRKLINSENYDEMAEVINALPQSDDFSAVGNDGDAGDASNAKYYAEAAKIQREEGLSYKDALIAAEERNPGLFSEAANEIPADKEDRGAVKDM